VRAALAAVALAAAGCGPDATCEQLVAHVLDLAPQAGGRDALVTECKKENPPSRVRSCVMAARTLSALNDCPVEPKGPAESVEAYQQYMKKSKATEAELSLRQLSKAIRAYYVEQAQLPPDDAGPTPPVGACCKARGGKCEPDPTLWTGTWADLRFEMDEPSRYSYWYERKAPDHAVVHAIGDLDCDGITSDLSIDVTVVDGNPQLSAVMRTQEDE
jgi:hypothetical protein